MRLPLCFAAVLALLSNAAALPFAHAAGCNVDTTEFQPEEAIGACTEVLAKSSLDTAARAQALYVRGRGYHRSKHLDLALRDYTAAIELTPDDPEILLGRSNVYLRQHILRGYVHDVQRANLVAPENPHVLTAIGTAYRNSGQPQMALEFYSRAIKAAPDDAFAVICRMEIYWIVHDYARATSDADTAVRLTAEAAKTKPLGYLDEDGEIRDFYVVALTERAGMLEDAGHLEQALHDHNEAVARDTSGLALMRRGEFYMAADKADLAQADLGASLRREPNNAAALYTLGLVLAKQQQYAQALDLFDRAVKARTGYAIALRMRAMMHRQLGHTDQAVDDLLHAMFLDDKILPQVLMSMRAAGYWTSNEDPKRMTPALADAIRACMIDVNCS